MLRKIFRSSGAGFAAVILSSASLLSYLVGLLRDRTMAVLFGSSSYVDAYNTAFLIPDLIFNLLIAGALTGVFIPLFSEYLQKDKRAADEFCHVFLTVMNGLTLLVSIVMYVIAPWVIPALFGQATPEIQLLIVDLTRILLISPVVMGLSNTLGSMLISHKRYVSYSLSAALYNIGIILGMLWLHESHGIYSAAYGVLIGLVFHLGIRWFDLLYVDYRYRVSWNIGHPAFRKMLGLMIPKTLGLLAWQGNLIAYNIIGYSLMGGSIAAFNYARNIQSFSVSLFGIALATAVFPFLAEFAAQKEEAKFARRLETTTSQILFLTIPASVGLAMLAPLAISVILGGGAFDERAIQMTTAIVVIFCCSIPLESLMHVFSRAFYSYQNTVIPVVINIGFMLMNIVLTLWLVPHMEVNAFPTAFVLASIVQVALLLIIFYKKFLTYDLRFLGVQLLKFVFASVAMAVTLEGVLFLFAGVTQWITFVVAIVIGSVVYLGITTLLGCKEISILRVLYKKICK